VRGSATTYPLSVKRDSGDSTASKYPEDDVRREILMHVAVFRSDVPEIVAAVGVSPLEIGRIVERYYAGLAAIRRCAGCGREFPSLAYSDRFCPICSIFDEAFNDE